MSKCPIEVLQHAKLIPQFLKYTLYHGRIGCHHMPKRKAANVFANSTEAGTIIIVVHKAN